MNGIIQKECQRRGVTDCKGVYCWIIVMLSSAGDALSRRLSGSQMQGPMLLGRLGLSAGQPDPILASGVVYWCWCISPDPDRER